MPDEDRTASHGDGRERPEHAVGKASEIPHGTHRVVKIGRREIGIFNIDGVFYALPNLCPHQTGPLCESKKTTGTLVACADNDWTFEWRHEGEIVACPWHGLEYHVPSGRCVNFPEIRLRSYEVFVDGDTVKVRT